MGKRYDTWEVPTVDLRERPSDRLPWWIMWAALGAAAVLFAAAFALVRAVSR